MRYLLALVLFVNSAWAKDVPSILLYNLSKNETIIEQSVNSVRPLASITKLMTAMVAMDSGISLYRQLPLYAKLGSFLPIKNWTREELLTATLVRSDNAAAETLAHDYPGGRPAFIAAMNAKARLLGMTNTNFNDASGLSNRNVSTAKDISKLLLAARSYDIIRDNSVKKQAIIETQIGKRVRTIKLDHTSASMLFKFDNIVVTKTGLTSLAGWCVAMVVEENGQTYHIVVLGSKTKQQRLDKIKEIMYNHIIDERI
jgi:D-alanyl-D-alanine endopeptidase (penicillin-binding protein 7)